MWKGVRTGVVAMSGSGLKTLSFFLLVALVLYAAASGGL